MQGIAVSGLGGRLRACTHLDVSAPMIEEAIGAIREVLAESIAHGSTMNVDPENIDGSYYGGAYEGHWRVYDREGEPCPKCRRPILRVTHAGRSTYYCGRCQNC